MINADITSFSDFDHITVVVKDIERSMEYYQSLGIGPFVPVEGGFARGLQHERKLFGKTIDKRVIAREARMGPIVLQLVQYLEEGSCLGKEWIETRGQGVYHLGFTVADVDKEEEKLVKQGLKVSERGRREDGTGYTFFDTEELGGVILEIRSGYLERTI